MDKKIRKKEKQPLVSVIMAAHNAEKYIAEAIESVINQTYKNWELIIADDESTDTTRDIADSYATKDPRVKVFTLEKNSGQAIARNMAIDKSKGEYLAILDADDISLPNRLADQVSFLDFHPDISLVGSCAKLINEEEDVIGVKKKPSTNNEIRFKLLLQTQFITSTVCFTRAALHEVGSFDTQYIHAEDYDLWSRFMEKNKKLANINEALVLHRIHPTSVTRKKETQKVQERNSLDINARNVARFIDIPAEKLKNLVNFANNRPLSMIELISALWWYHRLAKNYIASDECTETEASYVKRIHKTMRTHSIKTKVKRVLHLI